MSAGWRAGNRVSLLENGEAFFPRVVDVLSQARHEVLLETFILREDKVGLAIRDALLAAARRGARVTVTLDGFGSAELSAEFIASLCDAGITLRIFDPQPLHFGRRTNWFRRLHRKIVVVDAEIGFVGGINFSANHLADFGPEAKQDYAVEVEGPVVQTLRDFLLEQADLPLEPPAWRTQEETHAERGAAEVALVTRDNDTRHTDIERHYRLAARLARRELVLCNAYFFPGYRLVRDLRNAARRGVAVTLILQGEPDMPIAQLAARTLYRYLMRAGVVIHEYCRRPLHAKVALVDDEWATVGSSNLDPLSLALNLEANLMIRDRAFNAELRGNLDRLRDTHCRAIAAEEVPLRSDWRMVFGVIVFHLLRIFPGWSGLVPAHRQRIELAGAPKERP
ncbi:cardiolipin synthase ClsB [Coralloluteibacterium stylophorae]|uniref:Cardiolipin synthase B n=1 Tax=Coralloluteibacterium stylophorae TaxID=1776034 RepID=A0A8J8AYH7_9GAMM|nr:cardiolipin synthase ClsB [Coralloluteibacterium stylophorae]